MAMIQEGLLALWLDRSDRLSPAAAQLLERAGFVLRVAGERSLHLREVLEADVIILRIDGSGRSLGAQLAEWGLDERQPLPRPVIGRVPSRDIAAAVRILEQGASHALASDDWMLRSWQDAQRRIVRARSAPAFVFVDPVSEQMLMLAERVARTDVNVLLDGPTGAGKDVLARIIHDTSPRADQPFIAFNCAALPENLIEDTLFGHEKGAFTGAHREHPGLFEQAQHGTLFLDEIGDMPLHLQVKLLRVLQERQCVRLGGQRLISLDLRILAATHRDLPQAIRARSFREDLFFRLSTFRITVPALARRPRDILPLARCFLAQHATGRPPPELSSDAESRLLRHAWPGNVRELQNVMQRALVLCDTGVVEVEHLLFDALFDADPYPAAHPVSPDIPVTQPVPGSPVPGSLVWKSGAPGAAQDFSPFAAEVPPVTFAMPRTTVNASGFALPEHFPGSASLTAGSGNEGHVLPGDGSLQNVRDVHECQTIAAAIAGSRSRLEAAEKLGISPRTLRYRLARLRERGFALPAGS